MKANEIYKRFLLKINKNDTNEGINILPSLFVLMFNSEAQRWIGQKIDGNGDNIGLDNLDVLLETDIELVKGNKKDDWVEFKIPEDKDIHRHSHSFAFVKKGNCQTTIFYFEKKSLGLTATLADDFNKAQFDFEEAPFIITKGNIKAYVDGFEITKFLTSFYRFPKSIDIAGYTKIDGSSSEDIDCELHSSLIEEIINRLVLEVIRQYKDGESFQYSKDRIQTEP